MDLERTGLGSEALSQSAGSKESYGVFGGYNVIDSMIPI